MAPQENDIFYLKACAHRRPRQQQQAETYFRKATVELNEPTQAIYYNDQQPDKIFYQGASLEELGENAKADRIFNALVNFGNAPMNDVIKIDYFAVSLPDLLVFDQDLDLGDKIHCHYLMGLGNLGLGHAQNFHRAFQFCIAAQPYPQGDRHPQEHGKARRTGRTLKSFSREL